MTSRYETISVGDDVLRREGVDVGAADAVYGTSAGSFVGAQLALGLDIAGTVSQLVETRQPILASALVRLDGRGDRAGPGVSRDKPLGYSHSWT